MIKDIPIYLQISRYIENEILQGHLKAEDQVPSMNDFSRIMQVNPATAGKGLNALVDQGILFKKRGLGMFVSEEALAIIRQERKKRFMHTLLPEFILEAQQLDISMTELEQMIKEEYHDKND